VLVVLGHGRRASLNHALVEALTRELHARGAETRVHDLLEDGFDPVLRLAPGERHPGRADPALDPLLHRYQVDVRWSELLVIVHPVWWFAPPAILKGWVDRVLADGVALRQEPGAVPRPLLEGRRGFLVQTFNTHRTVDRLVFRGLSSFFWKHAVFAPVGIRQFARYALYGVEDLDREEFDLHCRRMGKVLGSLLPRP
jgi:putative NADPH-quinone reductase